MSHIDPLFQLSLAVSWSLVLVGFASGAFIGLSFHKTEWFGGYGSFPRRILRLGHIACFGLPILNTLLVLLYLVIGIPAAAVWWGVILWVVGQISMPLICFLSAWKEPFRHGFPVPVTSLMIGTLLVFWGAVHA